MKKILKWIIVWAVLVLFMLSVIVIWAGLGYLVGLLIHSFIPSFNPAWAVIVFLLVIFIKK